MFLRKKVVKKSKTLFSDIFIVKQIKTFQK